MNSMTVGTCGYGYYDAPEGWKDEYESKLQAFTHEFELLEVNRTFYTLPRTSTCEKWRQRGADGFEFTMKAWQALTHPISSPTWRGKDDSLDEVQRDEVGYLRPNDTIRDAWEQILDRAEALGASVLLVQCPAGFDPADKHEHNMRKLFGNVDRRGVEIAWEPRGDWLDQPERVASICEDLQLTHVVDVLREKPAFTTDTAYVRMHGLNEDRYDYDYDYDTGELETLAAKLKDLAEDCDRVYCLFNNYEKFSNARELESLLE